MTQYVYFNSSSKDPKPIIGWFDTEVVDYPNLPPNDSLLEVTEDQWTQHMSDLKGEHFTIQNGSLVYMVIPPSSSSSAERGQNAYDSFISAGIRITSSENPSLNGTYAIDSESQVDIAAINQYTKDYGSFPPNSLSSLGERLPWTTMDSTTPQIFTSVVDFQNLAKAVATAVASARIAKRMIAVGQEISMPNSTIIIP